MVTRSTRATHNTNTLRGYGEAAVRVPRIAYSPDPDVPTTRMQRTCTSYVLRVHGMHVAHQWAYR